MSDVRTYADNQLCAAVVMRLSDHRQWPVASLRRWQANPFPPANPDMAGAGIVGAMWMAGVPEKARRRKEALEISARFLEKEFQTAILQSWGT